MKKTISTALVITTILFASSFAHSAAYIKFDGIKGEAIATEPSTSAAKHTKKKVKTSSAQPVGLLLPAVQSAREAARR